MKKFWIVLVLLAGCESTDSKGIPLEIGDRVTYMGVQGEVVSAKPQPWIEIHYKDIFGRIQKITAHQSKVEKIRQ